MINREWEGFRLYPDEYGIIMIYHEFSGLIMNYLGVRA